MNRLLSAACFAGIAALHIALLCVFGAESGEAAPETRVLFLDLAAPIAPAELPVVPEPVAVAPLPVAEVPVAAAEVPVVPEPEPVAEVPVAAEVPIAVPVSEAGEAAVIAPQAAAVGVASAMVGAAAVGAAGAMVGAAGRALSESDYLALIMGRLEKNKVYPLSVRKRGIEGDITVAFVIKRDGTVSDVQLADAAGHRFLAQAAFESVRSASPFPVMEGRGDYPVQVRIRYRLED
jgi:TonB family protein